METVLKKIRYTFELVKFSHTVFALPFALVAYFLATNGRLEPRTLFWVLVCLVTARTAAMAFNRLADEPFDQKNPRTQGRHLPKGLLSRSYVTALTAGSSVLFVLAAKQLNLLAFWLAPICLAILFFYSLTKRFTSWTQFFLGLALGIAPIGATIAVLGRITLPSVVLGLAVLFWVAGFDLLYSLQDLDFDEQAGLHSLALRLGKKRAFAMARLFHSVFFLFLGAFGTLAHMGRWYWAGWILSGIFLFWQHWNLRDNLKNLQASFFTANGLLSIFFLGFFLLDIYFK
jgi:4-hydroxybenzoate polyprenyltransferase